MLYKTTTSDVLIFKTSFQSQDMEVIKSLLSINNVLSWTIDLGDIDKVLRIESVNLQHEEIITLVTNAGYSCEELL